MQAFLYVEINVFALAVLFLIYLKVFYRTKIRSTDQKLFFSLLGFNALELVLDTAMWVLDGKTGGLLRAVYLLVTVAYYIINPLICMLWTFYADYLVFQDESRLKKLRIPLMLPTAVNAVLSILSLWNGALFYMDGSNIYHRGDLFYLMPVISYIYLVYTFINIIINHKKIHQNYFIPVVVFALPPFIGGIIQSFFYGISLIWVCMTLSVLIIFINIQNDQLCTDYLTGLFNRRQLDAYLQEQVKNRKNKKLVAGIMIDLNCFKMINDKYGHCAGDRALEYTAQILKNTFRDNDFIARYGGDEFVVIAEMADSLVLQKVIDRLQKNLSRFNSQKKVPYEIDLSLGYDFFDMQSGVTVAEFLQRIDGLMYEDKMNKKMKMI